MTSSVPQTPGVSATVACLPGKATATVHAGSGISANAAEIEAVAAGAIAMGTSARGTFLANTKLAPDCKAKTDADEAFKKIKEDARAANVAGFDIVAMSMNLDKCLITFYSADPKAEPKTMTFGQFKKALADSGQQKVEDTFCERCRTMDTAFAQAGISTISHYSPIGGDKMGSEIGGAAFQSKLITDLDRLGLVQAKEADTLLRSVKEKNEGITGLVKRHPTSKKEAAKKVLHAEAFYIRFRDKLSENIQTLTAKFFQEADKAEQKKLQAQLERMTQLCDMLKNDVNRHAFWATVLYDDPEDCYDALLRDYYEDFKKSRDQYPSFEEFKNLAVASGCRQWAAEAASMLIQDPAEYRLFCHNKGIDPRENHINRFLCQAANEKYPFGSLDIAFDDTDRQSIEGIANQAHKEVQAVDQAVDRVSGLDPHKILLEVGAQELLTDRLAPTWYQRFSRRVSGWFS